MSCKCRAQVSNSSPWGPQCLLVFGTFSAPVVQLSHWLAKEFTRLVLKALIDSWLKGNHKNLQTLWPPGNSVWHPWCRGKSNKILGSLYPTIGNQMNCRVLFAPFRMSEGKKALWKTLAEWAHETTWAQGTILV